MSYKPLDNGSLVETKPSWNTFIALVHVTMIGNKKISTSVKRIYQYTNLNWNLFYVNTCKPKIVGLHAQCI